MALVVGLPLSDFEFTTLDPADSTELLEAVTSLIERHELPSHTPPHGSVEVDPAHPRPRSA